MSSPSETQSHGSFHTSSQDATGAAYEDTASSAQRMGPPPGVSVQFVASSPNATYTSRLRDVRVHSVSLRLRRTISPTSLSVVQQRARFAEQKVEDAFSGVGVVAD